MYFENTPSLRSQKIGGYEISNKFLVKSLILFKDKKIRGIFQPHLFTRTRDLIDEFVESLELLDELILLEIYPAREQPIEGINAQFILDKIKLKNKRICSKDEIIPYLKDQQLEVLLTMGAGDIDKLVQPIKENLDSKK